MALRGSTRRQQLKAVAAASDYDAVAGVAGKRIVVTAFVISLSAAINVTFKSTTSNTEHLGPLYFGANSGQSYTDEEGLFMCDVGRGLSIARSGSAAIGGCLRYKLIDG